ncbi:hypothetical protein DFJ73DRAFT_530884 [Zopfochytrium polystomum]|nr:hypothetical protein DFJ73DRAFT_530884 [Zopfochytrium polystomum]
MPQGPPIAAAANAAADLQPHNSPASPAAAASDTDTAAADPAPSRKSPADRVALPSAWAAFDTMQLCYTVIPQARHYYRYGTFRDCARARRDFVFAMSLKGLSRAEAERRVVEREVEHYVKKVTERPSRDVWELRDAPPVGFPPTVDAARAALAAATAAAAAAAGAGGDSRG